MRQWFKKLLVSGRGFSESWPSDMRVSVRNLQREVDWALFRVFMFVSTILHVSLFSGISLGVNLGYDNRFALLASQAWGVTGAATFLVVIASFIQKHPSHRFMWFASMLCSLVPHLAWFYIAKVGVETGQITRVNCYAIGAIFGIIGIYAAMSGFVLGFSALPVMVIHVALTIALWSIHESHNGWMFSVVSGVGTTMALLLFVFTRGTFAELIKAYLDSIQLREKNQRLKLESVQTDVEIARKLHETLMPPPAEVSVGRYKIRFFHRPIGLLGGDWYAYRELADGTSVIAVGDVTGKGVAAAMVVQSVQTLWAESLQSPTFVVSDWLQTVHETLLKLGERHILSLSMGIVLLRQNSLDYYSAGHVPLINISLSPERPGAAQVLGGGHLLGVTSASRPIKPVSLLLNKSAPQLVLLGTDGVIETHLRVSQKSLQKFAADFVEHGVKALPNPTDDQILIQIFVNPSNNAAGMEWPKSA